MLEILSVANVLFLWGYDIAQLGRWIFVEEEKYKYLWYF